jgi:hypothetical protein
MNPLIIQAAAAERTREMHAYAAARGRAAEVRRSRRAWHAQPVRSAPRAGRASWVLRALRAS